MRAVLARLSSLCLVCSALLGCRAEEPWVEGFEGGTVGGYETPDMPGLVAITDPNEVRPLVETAGLAMRRGPFPFAEDGLVYENIQERLPLKPHGYYTEYTVPTPGVQGRGARRLIRGAGEELYYWQPEKIEFLALHEPPP
jgi:ribonuclease T1